MSTDTVPDIQIAQCFDFIIDRYIAKERKITRRKGQIIEIIFKLFELIRNTFEILE